MLGSVVADTRDLESDSPHDSAGAFTVGLQEFRDVSQNTTKYNCLVGAVFLCYSGHPETSPSSVDLSTCLQTLLERGGGLVDVSTTSPQG